MRMPRARLFSIRAALPAVVALVSGAALDVEHLSAQSKTEPIKPNPFNERWRSSVPVSGGLRVGIMSVPNEERPDAKQFWVLVPAMESPKLCAEISSRDGRYEASLEYSLAGVPRGALVPFEFPSKYRYDMRELKASELAIITRAGDGCGSEDGTYVVSSWTATRPTDMVTVYLNSRVPTVIVALVNGTVRHEVPCEDLRGASTSFNLYCKVDLRWLSEGAELYVRKRERRGGTRVAIVDTPLPLRM